MANRIFDLNTEKLFRADAFLTATAEELRVLVAIMADRSATDAEIAEAAGVSTARCRAAITLFSAEGILSCSETVRDEFSPSDTNDSDEDSALSVARDIRDKGLASLISEFSALINKPALSTGQVKKIVALYTNYSLSEEYILALAAHLADLGKLTVTRLSNEAIRLVEREIDTPELLYAYIEEKKRTTDADARLRKLFGIFGRSITKTEHELFSKWIYEFGFSENIIGEAYDICVGSISKFSAAYIDHILTRWHDCGCKTLDDCLMCQERDRAAIAEEKKRRMGTKTAKKSEPKAPKYGAFSAEDALMRALERSYGSEDD